MKKQTKGINRREFKSFLKNNLKEQIYKNLLKYCQFEAYYDEAYELHQKGQYCFEIPAWDSKHGHVVSYNFNRVKRVKKGVKR